MSSNTHCSKLCLLLNKDPLSVAYYHPQQVSLSFYLSKMGTITAPTHKCAVGQLSEMEASKHAARSLCIGVLPIDFGSDEAPREW